MPIRRLPPLLVNQIAAGEVIERPASVVKELVENALDAGARRVVVTIEGGGGDLVRVEDDGAGIPGDELELAVAPHATSKIAEAEDLEAIATLGFRGEALASIASVSRLTIVSRPAGCEAALRLEVEGDRVGPVAPAGAAPGTTITVRNLFFNTPARRKFLKSDQTEYGRIASVLESLALAHPAVAFVLRHGDRVTRELRPQGPRERVRDVLGRELESHLIEVERRTPGAGVWGLVGRPDIARANARHVRIFLNGRPITDRTAIHAVREAYRGLIEPGRHPTAALFLDVDPAEVDVNVHPAKAEVRFRHASAIHGLILGAVRDALAEADLVPALDADRAAPAPGFGASGGTGHGSGTGVPVVFDQPPPSRYVLEELRAAIEARPPASPATLAEVKPAGEILQVHATYLVAEDDDGLVIVDQHALHERVMFERLKARVERGSLESQQLLMPAVVETDAAGLEALETLGPLLERLGIDARPLGPRSLGVHAFTSLLFERGVEPSAFMTDLLARATGDGLGSEPEAALHEVLDMMSCKAAIKAGDRLTLHEMRTLLESRELVDRSTRCPHGRPTTLRLSLAELERQFGRR